MQNIREKLKRKLSMHDKNRTSANAPSSLSQSPSPVLHLDPKLPSPPTTPLTPYRASPANFDEHNDHEEIDDETTGHLSREIEKAEQEGHPQGKPGSFLNRMISHGNKKTEDQIAEEQRRAAEGQAAPQGSTMSGLGGGVGEGGRKEKDDGVIR